MEGIKWLRKWLRVSAVNPRDEGVGAGGMGDLWAKSWAVHSGMRVVE
jgi:hypothetical protein